MTTTPTPPAPPAPPAPPPTPAERLATLQKTDAGRRTLDAITDRILENRRARPETIADLAGLDPTDFGPVVALVQADPGLARAGDLRQDMVDFDKGLTPEEELKLREILDAVRPHETNAAVLAKVRSGIPGKGMMVREDHIPHLRRLRAIGTIGQREVIVETKVEPHPARRHGKWFAISLGILVVLLLLCAFAASRVWAYNRSAEAVAAAEGRRDAAISAQNTAERALGDVKKARDDAQAELTKAKSESQTLLDARDARIKELLGKVDAANAAADLAKKDRDRAEQALKNGAADPALRETLDRKNQELAEAAGKVAGAERDLLSMLGDKMWETMSDAQRQELVNVYNTDKANIGARLNTVFASYKFGQLSEPLSLILKKPVADINKGAAQQILVRIKEEAARTKK